ncbi:sugar ABC transporter substrate-binding protein [Oceanivirga salmonicida]|uniref:sugar ABC transporter substrate-binding protein n=1 Tax=Oceanivirga salmonicida TaxID=1769291 RepID=UPI0012E11318|nr:substrate-binding domain-containing protein [Oceanivirga salmonicida]
MSIRKLGIILFAMLTFVVSCGEKNETNEVENIEIADLKDPDTADGITFQKLREELGGIPKYSDEIKLGSVSKAFENEYWRTIKEGEEIAYDLFKKNGYNLSIEIKSAQGEGDEQGQLSIVNDMVNKNFSALLLSPISDGNLIPAVEKARKAGIPVINVNDGVIKNTDIFVGPRIIQEGENAAKWIAEKIGYKGKVAIVIGTPKAYAARQRTIGFENWINKNAPEIEIVEKQNADWDRVKAKDMADIWLKKHPDLKAIFANNDVMALGVQEAVNSFDKEVLVVGVDGIGEAYKSIKNGELDATIDVFPKIHGQISVEMAIRYLSGQKLPRVIWTPQAVIDKTNVDKTAEEIISWKLPEFEK